MTIYKEDFTCGTFDLYHIRHLNTLKTEKEMREIIYQY